MAKRKRTPTINNIVVVSDLHCGCRLGLCPPAGAKLDDGGRYMPSRLQRVVWNWWTEFWDDWVPRVTHGEPFAVVGNGDVIEGVHHRATSQISQNIEDQCQIAYEALAPVVERCDGRFFMVRGTPAHAGEQGVHEERLAKQLGAVPNEDGQHARYELWKTFGTGRLAHFNHHIGTTSSSQHETSAVNAELAHAFVEAGRWGHSPPDVVVRCLSYDTEILTRSGWTSMDDVVVGMEALTFNTFTGELQWQRVKDRVVNPIEPEMVHITGKGLDILVTPDHTMITRWARGGWRPMPAKELLASSREIPVSGQYLGQELPLTGAELWLLGFLIADGCLVRNPRTGEPYAARLCQQARRRDEVESRLREAGITSFSVSENCQAGCSHWDSRHGRWITTRSDCLSWYIPQEFAIRLVSQLNDDKSLRPRLLELTGGQFWSFMDGLMYGDGSRTGAPRFHNTNLRLMDQLQELLVKNGAKSNLRIKGGYTTKRGKFTRMATLNFVRDKQSVQINQNHGKSALVRLIPYDKPSWCVTVENKTLVTRRNGAVAIVGNSHRHRCSEIRIPSQHGYSISFVTPAWQLKTPFAYKVAGCRQTTPQIGGSLIRQGDEELHARHWVRDIGRSKAE